MTIADELDGLRRAIPGCSAVVLGDMSARLVLRASLARQMPQETLDRICATAASLLTGPLADVAASEGSAGHVALIGGGGVRIFVRSPADEADMLCCLCPPDVDINGAAGLARSALAAIAARP